jgi:hypothetical protein
MTFLGLAGSKAQQLICNQPSHGSNPWRASRLLVFRSADAAYHRKWYQDNRTKRIKQIRVSNDRIKERNKQHVRSYLATHPCVDCGETDVIVLEFDHVRGKKRDSISRMLACGVSVATIDKEIAKCDVRCANCHRRKTHERRIASREGSNGV